MPQRHSRSCQLVQTSLSLLSRPGSQPVFDNNSRSCGIWRECKGGGPQYRAGDHTPACSEEKQHCLTPGRGLGLVPLGPLQDQDASISKSKLNLWQNPTIELSISVSSFLLPKELFPPGGITGHN